MATFKLKDEQTEEIDIGNSTGIAATNVSDTDAKFYVDYQSSPGHWSPITGEITIKPGNVYAKTRVELGHDHIRVGAQGKDDGTVIISGLY